MTIKEIYVTSITKHFSRDPLYVDTKNKAKKKKVLRRLVVNWLLNCVRKHFNQPIVPLQQEFADVMEIVKVSVPKNACIDILENAGFKMRHTILAYTISSIRKPLRRSSTSNPGGIPNEILSEAISKTVNKIFKNTSDSNFTTSKEEIRSMIEKELTKKKPHDIGVAIPDMVDPEIYARYSTAIIKEFGDSEYVKYAIVRSILMKVNKMKAIEADKYIPKGVDKSVLSSVKKRLNVMIKSGTV